MKRTDDFAMSLILLTCPKIGLYQGDFVRCNTDGTCWNWFGSCGICGTVEGFIDVKIYDIT